MLGPFAGTPGNFHPQPVSAKAVSKHSMGDCHVEAVTQPGNQNPGVEPLGGKVSPSSGQNSNLQGFETNPNSMRSPNHNISSRTGHLLVIE